MATPEDNLNAMGLTLPAPLVVPDGLHIPFVPVNIRGDRALLAGHARLGPDGAITGPYGVLGADMTTEEGYAAARDIALSTLANLKAAIGELSRVTGWLRVFGMVTSAPAFTDQHKVVDGYSDTIIRVFGPEVGRHSRSAIGVSNLPMGFAIEVEGEVLIAP